MDNNKRKRENDQDSSNKRNTNSRKEIWQPWPTALEMEYSKEKRQTMDRSGCEIEPKTIDFLDKKTFEDRNNMFKGYISNLDSQYDAEGSIKRIKKIVNSGELKNFLITFSGVANERTGYKILMLSVENGEQYYDTVVFYRNLYDAIVMNKLAELRSIMENPQSNFSVNKYPHNIIKDNPTSTVVLRDYMDQDMRNLTHGMENIL